jgi:hypothetical protein
MENKMAIENMNQPEGAADLPAKKIAFVIDDQIVEVLHTNETLGAILLSNPTIVDISSVYGDVTNNPGIGWIHNLEDNSIVGNNIRGETVSLSLNPESV